jgi:predicted nucleotidyltransferase
MKTKSFSQLNFNKIKKQVISLLKEEKDIIAVYVFGSIVSDYTTPHSDIDLGILFKENFDFKQELLIGARLESRLKRKVDLINLNRASLSLAFRIISTGTLILENDSLLLSDYLENLFTQYHDFIIDHKHFLKEYNKSLEEYFLSA